MTLLCYISLKLQANLLDTVPAGGGVGGGAIPLHISYVRMRFPKRCRFGLLAILVWNRVWLSV